MGCRRRGGQRTGTLWDGSFRCSARRGAGGHGDPPLSCPPRPICLCLVKGGACDSISVLLASDERHDDKGALVSGPRAGKKGFPPLNITTPQALHTHIFTQSEPAPRPSMPFLNQLIVPTSLQAGCLRLWMWSPPPPHCSSSTSSSLFPPLPPYTNHRNTRASQASKHVLRLLRRWRWWIPWWWRVRRVSCLSLFPPLPKPPGLFDSMARTFCLMRPLLSLTHAHMHTHMHSRPLPSLQPLSHSHPLATAVAGAWMCLRAPVLCNVSLLRRIT